MQSSSVPLRLQVGSPKKYSPILPLPGKVCPDYELYSTLNNETPLHIANKLGCTWQEIVKLNRMRYGPMNQRSRFRRGTYLYIPDGRSLALVKGLAMPREHHDDEVHLVTGSPLGRTVETVSVSTEEEEVDTPASSVDSRRGSLVDLTDDDTSIPTTTQKKKPSPEAQSTRKSNRKTKSTLVHINGHAVLRVNNYSVTADSYIHNTTPTTNQPPPKRKPPSSKPTQTPLKKPRQRSAAQEARQKHKAFIQHYKRQKFPLRQSYMAHHVSKLATFLEPKIIHGLESWRECPHYLPPSDTKKNNQDNMTQVNLQPDLIQAEMRDYQLIGLNWMVHMHRQNLAMILGDEMGLGKTLQTISLLAYLKEQEGRTGPSLVICPLTVLYSWCQEITKWAPSLKYLRFHSSNPEERESQRRELLMGCMDQYDIVVTTYEMAKNPQLRSLWSSLHFHYLVLDEGHIIKERSTQISAAVRRMHYENTLLLTGTPLQNNLVELWAILNYLYPEYFTSGERFEKAFDLGRNVVDREVLKEAHRMLGLFMLRRLKVEVEKLLPKKIETKVVCPLSAMQIHWYKGILMKDINLLARLTSDTNSSSTLKATKTGYRQLQNLVMQLRKCCLHPFLFEGAETGDPEDTSVEDLVAASGKLAVLDQLLRRLFLQGHRVVVFSQFTRVLDIIDDYCQLRGWRYTRFDGSTPRAKRNFLINRFNAPQSQDFVFLMSTRSGGMGINLQTADTCILFDSDWNPQPDLQAQARVHRIGQKKTVHVYRLVSGGTIEERIVERAEKKLFLDQMVNGGKLKGHDGDEEDGEQGSGLTAADLLETLQFGSNAVFGDASSGLNELPTKEEVMAIIDRTRTEDTSVGLLKGGTTKTAKEFDAERKFTSTTTLSGVDFKAIREAREKKKMEQQRVPKGLASHTTDTESLISIANGWDQNQTMLKRVRKNRILMVNGKGSGYGDKLVPVLASNNYELQHGESSVYDRELSSTSRPQEESRKKFAKAGVDFQHQEFCQVCGLGGHLMQCGGCPMSLHAQCSSEYTVNMSMTRCPHHRCTSCGKTHSYAGGILFPCQACTNSFCEDCLPTKDVRFLYVCPRLEELGYESTKFHCYIHCSQTCEEDAEERFGWRPEEKCVATCPDEIDVGYAFGARAARALEEGREEEKSILEQITEDESMEEQLPNKIPSREKSMLNKATKEEPQKVWSWEDESNGILSKEVQKTIPARETSKKESSEVWSWDESCED